MIALPNLSLRRGYDEVGVVDEDGIRRKVGDDDLDLGSGRNPPRPLT
jgi:hypothetical protein